MKISELASLFPSEFHWENRILFIPPSEFPKLAGKHIAPCRMLILVCEGSLTLRLDNRPCELRALTLLDLPDRFSVTIDTIARNTYAYCWIHTFLFAGETLKNLKPGPDQNLIDRIHSPQLNLTAEETDTMMRQLELLEAVFRRTGHHYRQELIRTQFRALTLELGQILFAHEDNPGEPTAFGQRDRLMLGFLKLVWANYRTEHQVDFYAERLHVSNKHLTRVIKEILNRTPHAIICDEIVHCAMTLLEDSTTPIQQIAETLSFSDQASFSKFFKKHKGISPIAYRKLTSNGD